MESLSYPAYYAYTKPIPKISPEALARTIFFEEKLFCFTTGYYLKPYAASEMKILDCTMGGAGAHSSFYETAIPNANFLDTSNDLCDKTSKYPNTYPTKEIVIATMDKLGCTTSDTIVLYSQPHSDQSMTRAFHILHSYGFTDVFVLDGGLLDYTMKGFPTTKGIDYSGPSSDIKELVDPTPHLIKMDEIVDFALGKKPNMQLIDCRSQQQYDGQDPSLPPGCRQGHVPGAINIPADLFINASDDTFLKPDDIMTLLASKGVDTTKDLAVMCKSGVMATVGALALLFVGYTGARLYDGSWTEYGSNDTPSAQLSYQYPMYVQPSVTPTPIIYVLPSGEQYMAINNDQNHYPVYQM